MPGSNHFVARRDQWHDRQRVDAVEVAAGVAGERAIGPEYRETEPDVALVLILHFSPLIKTISRFLERFPTEHIDTKWSLDSKLQFESMCFIRIRSRNQDTFKKDTLVHL